ncbi:MAG: hypothetical protein ACREEC_14805 [Thermoplasmata archaeon]
MKLHKVVNREYRGKTYFRWILMVPPKVVGELGWREGETIAMEVRGRALKVHPVEEEPPRERGPAKRSS